MKTWLITGTSRGFGREWAVAALERGDRAVATARSVDSLKDLQEQYGERILALALDVTDRRAADAAIQSIVAHHHRLDILIANAGVIHRAPLADWTSEAWDEVLAANLKACFF